MKSQYAVLFVSKPAWTCSWEFWEECKSIPATRQHADFACRALPSSGSKYPCTLSFSHGLSRKDLLLWLFLLQVESLDMQKTEGILSENQSKLHIILLWSCRLRPHLCWMCWIWRLLVQLDTKKIPKKGRRGEGKKDKERREEVVRGKRQTTHVNYTERIVWTFSTWFGKYLGC